jgi:putative ABC transport system permease protein
MRRFFHRLLNAVRDERSDAEAAREIAAHLALLEDEYRRRGMTPDEARRAARRALGSSALARDLHRDARAFAWIDDARRDIAHGLRALRRTPGFTAIAVITLALGIGANTAIFSVISAVLLRPLPYPNADRLIQVFSPPPNVPGGAGIPRGARAILPPHFDVLRAGTRTLSHVAGYVLTSATLTGQGDAVRLAGLQITAPVFPMLGVSPLLGRPFTASEESVGADAVVVLSHTAWQRYFNSDPSIIGRVASLDGRGRTIVGVMPDGFEFPDAHVQYWIPYVPPDAKGGAFFSLTTVARLRDGAAVQAAEDEVNTLVRAADARIVGRFEAAGMHDELVAPVRPALLILAGAVGLVLLIACVNVANLLLARSAAREHEIAVRRAVGASPGRLFRQLLAESTLLSAIGATAGTVLAVVATDLLQSLATSLPRRDLGPGVSLPRLDEVGIDLPVLAFTIVVALATGLISGLLPALRHARAREADRLRERVASPRVRGALVVAEIAMAMMLLVGGGLLIRSFLKLATQDLGYDSTRVVTFQATPRGSGPAARAFAEQLVERIEALPGVSSAGYANNLPLVQQSFGRDVSPQPYDRVRPRPPFPGLHAVSPHLIQALGLRIVEGRSFSAGDAARGEALVTQTFARSGFFDGPAIGGRIYTQGRTGETSWEVVGILDDIKQFRLDQRGASEFFIVDFVPAPPGLGGTYFAVRTDSDPAAIVTAVRGVVRQMDPSAAVDNVATMEQIVSNAMSRPRLYAVLLGIFAGVAMVLAVIGIYGVLAHVVAHRAREIGIRMALGAQRFQVVGLVLRQTVVLTIVGIVAGLAGAAALSRYVEGLLFGLTPLDLTTFAAVVVMFVAVATLASYVPARRAARVDPLVALRAE